LKITEIFARVVNLILNAFAVFFFASPKKEEQLYNGSRKLANVAFVFCYSLL
jgi:hypothetical protein